MRTYVESDTLDEAQLDSLIAQKKELIAVLTKQKIMLDRQIYAILNVKQRTMFSDMTKKCNEMKMNH